MSFYSTTGTSISSFSNFSQPGQALQDAESLRFPTSLSDLGIPYVLFSPYKRDRMISSPFGTQYEVLPELPMPSWTIALPIPSSALSTQYSVSYKTPSMGPGGGVVMSGLQGLVRNSSVSELSTDKVTDALSSVVNTATTSGAIAANKTMEELLRVGGITDEPASAVGLALGKVLNPFTEVMFDSVGFRSHSFVYRFYPRNVAESEQIDKIIQRFKFFMHPAYGSTGEAAAIAGGAVIGGLVGRGIGAATGAAAAALSSADLGTWLEFPYEWQIYYSINNTTFTLMPSVLDSMTVSYAPDVDTPKLFAPTPDGRRYPTSISVSMTFKETFILTRNYIDTGINVAQKNANTDTLGLPIPSGANPDDYRETQFGTTYRF